MRVSPLLRTFAPHRPWGESDSGSLDHLLPLGTLIQQSIKPSSVVASRTFHIASHARVVFIHSSVHNMLQPTGVILRETPSIRLLLTPDWWARLSLRRVVWPSVLVFWWWDAAHWALWRKRVKLRRFEKKMDKCEQRATRKDHTGFVLRSQDKSKLMCPRTWGFLGLPVILPGSRTLGLPIIVWYLPWGERSAL